MTYMTQTGDTVAKTSFFASIKTAISRFFNALSEARRRSEEIACFQNMSDRQLADIGMTRETIVAYVLRDQACV